MGVIIPNTVYLSIFGAEKPSYLCATKTRKITSAKM